METTDTLQGPHSTGPAVMFWVKQQLRVTSLRMLLENRQAGVRTASQTRGIARVS